MGGGLGPVSVPWRGLRSFGLEASGLAWEEVLDLFPSPGGDYGLSDLVGDRTFVPPTEGFRPLAGITVFRTIHL